MDVLGFLPSAPVRHNLNERVIMILKYGVWFFIGLGEGFILTDWYNAKQYARKGKK